MAYFYVRNDGTATGDGGRYATKQTGDWDTTFSATTAFYPTIASAVTTPATVPATGDVIIVSNIHSTTYTSSIIIAPLGHIKIVSVDDTEIETYLAGGVEQTSGSQTDINYRVTSRTRSVSMFGMTISVTDNMDFRNTDKGGYMYAENCIFKLNSASNANYINIGATDGTNVEWVNVDLQLPDVATLTTGGIQIGYGVNFKWTSGSIIINTTKTSHIFDHAGSGGANIDLSNIDFTNLTTSIFDVDTDQDSYVIGRISNCIKPSGVAYNSTALTGKSFQVTAVGTGDADQYYEFYYEDYMGTVDTELVIFRDNGATYDGTNNFSLLYTPINTLSFINQLSIDIPGAWTGDLTASLTVTLYIVIDNVTTAATALTDDMFGINVTRPDATNQALGVVQKSRTSTSISTPVALTSDTQAWSGINAGNAKKYKIEVTIPALVGVDNGRVLVQAWCAATGLHADDKIYVCPLFDMLS